MVTPDMSLFSSSSFLNNKAFKEVQLLQIHTWWPTAGAWEWCASSCCPWRRCQLAPRSRRPGTPWQQPSRQVRQRPPSSHSCPSWAESRSKAWNRANIIPEKSMHSAHRELEACPVRARLALDLGLAALSASRHVRLENKSSEKVSSSTRDLYRKCRDKNDADDHIYLELVYLVTALVPSDTACLASSPGRRRRTAVWISREVMVDLRTIQL